MRISRTVSERKLYDAFSMLPKSILLLFLLTILASVPCIAQREEAEQAAAAEEAKKKINQNPPPEKMQSLIFPVYAGEDQSARDLATSLSTMGSFPKGFGNCGNNNGLTLNECFKEEKKDIHFGCDFGPENVLVSSEENLSGEAVDGANYLTGCAQNLLCLATDYPAAESALEGQNLYNMHINQSDKATASEFTEEDKNICGAKRISSPVGKSKISFANEKSCPFTPPDSTSLHIVPRWMKAAESVYNKRVIYFVRERKEKKVTHPFIFDQPTSIQDEHEFKNCKAGCDKGTVVKHTMHSGSYRSMIYLNKGCKSVRICYGPLDFKINEKIPGCRPGGIIEILLDAGVVSWPNQGRSSLIQFKQEKDNFIALEFGFGITIEGKTAAEFYVGNARREYVISDSNGFSKSDAASLAYFFSDENCLYEKAGIFSKNIEQGFTLVKKDVEVVKGEIETESGTDIDGPQDETFFEATTIVPESFEMTTTPAAPVASLNSSKFTDMIRVQDADTAQAVYVDGKWWTWAIYLGIIIGTVISLGIGGGVYYGLRRTIFNFWYRAMYKRYGCDASGVTGGLTGVGFGDTATGAMTVTNTVGGTTATGTTATSTTSQAETSASSKTSQVSTLAL